MIGDVNVAVAEAMAVSAADAATDGLGLVPTAGVDGAAGLPDPHPDADAANTAAATTARVN
jgi:hypothetical protein